MNVKWRGLCGRLNSGLGTINSSIITLLAFKAEISNMYGREWERGKEKGIICALKVSLKNKKIQNYGSCYITKTSIFFVIGGYYCISSFLITKVMKHSKRKNYI